MTPSLTIRPAGPADASALATLIQALADYEHLPGPDGDARARLARDLGLSEPPFRAYLAELGGEAVGYALAFPTYSTFLGRPGLYLEDLFIVPERRGIGAGRALLAHLARAALERGYGRLEWSVLDWNRQAIEFYERLGARQNEGWLPYRITGEALEALGTSSPGR